METFSQVTGMVLAGGCGRRMGGEDKGLIAFNGRLMVNHIISRIQDKTPHILINANRNSSIYGRMGYRVVRDIRNGFLGPVAGIESGLKYAQTPLLWVVPCDTPLFPEDALERLLHAMYQEQVAAAYVVSDGQSLPVFCLLRSSLYANAVRYLDSGGRSMRGWLKEVGAAAVEWNGPQARFVGANSYSELSSMEKMEHCRDASPIFRVG